jgi:alpha,alpha-trehalase
LTGLCNENQAKKLVEIALPQFIQPGGITGSTKKQLLLEFWRGSTTMTFFFWLGSIKCCYGRLNQLWISDKASRDDLPMAVVDYKKCFEFNGTIPENSILKPG